jgi:hypothetical protein
VLLIGQPTYATWVGDVVWEAGFPEAVRLERGVGWVVVYSVVPISERGDYGPTMSVYWDLREETKIRGVLV